MEALAPFFYVVSLVSAFILFVISLRLATISESIRATNPYNDFVELTAPDGKWLWVRKQSVVGVSTGGQPVISRIDLINGNYHLVKGTIGEVLRVLK